MDSKYDNMAKSLRDDILSGRLAGLLPPERKLAEQFKVSYLTARRAVGILVENGLVSREHGRGLFVNRPGRGGGCRTSGIGFLVPERVLSGGWVLSHFYMEVFSGAASEARRHGFHLILESNPDNLMPLNREGGTGRVDGIIAICPDNPEILREVSRFVPVTILGYDCPALNLPSVFYDDRAGAANAVKYLIGQGHRRIAHIAGDKNIISYYARLAGYRQALETHGLELNPELEISHDRLNDFLKLMQNPAARRPDAVFCHCDSVSFSLIKQLGEHGWRLPDDLSVIGFDNQSFGEYCSPSLTSVNVPKSSLGAAGVRKIIKFINHGLPPDEYREEMELPLVIRQSVKQR